MQPEGAAARKHTVFVDSAAEAKAFKPEVLWRGSVLLGRRQRKEEKIPDMALMLS